MYTILFLALFPIGIFLAFVVVTVIITLREIHYVWYLAPQESVSDSVSASDTSSRALNARVDIPYQPPAYQQPTLPLTPYAGQKCRDFDSMQYEYLGDFRHAKGGIYKIRYDVWWSKDRYVLALIEAGKVAGIPVSNVSLITLGNPTHKGHPGSSPPQSAKDLPSICITTIVTEAAYEPDLTGATQTMLFPHANSGDQQRFHYQRLKLPSAVPFSANPLEDLYQFRIADAARIFESGNAQHIETSQKMWRPTLRGTMRIVADQYAFMLARRFYSDKRRLRKQLGKLESESSRMSPT
ncbi:hypothetical protein FF011L_39980 [Roseimaritima multifibrata]|uniref:Uncharacterized protein n=1 Tax=Roseimaritima multifibrata TaxID=1930274 RepID=A0A517MJY6_9BACT|nr:hypothetical protein [Roseimaritima multifibrata]QDS95205.1 hypothetical protein FF011L_39980 [Roseimaritima multifibrata]